MYDLYVYYWYVSVFIVSLLFVVVGESSGTGAFRHIRLTYVEAC